jgi:hypothetical protein
LKLLQDQMEDRKSELENVVDLLEKSDKDN